MSAIQKTSAAVALTDREKGFVDAFLGTCGGNGTQAAIAAGYAPRGARVQACRLLTKANIQFAIAERVNAREDAAIAVADERDRILSVIARDENAEARDRIRAISELNKCTGRHSVQHLHERSRTLEDILAESRL
jgi:phage terminase small subunit